jgi:F-type H+-transporting ATPase subunit gamma
MPSLKDLRSRIGSVKNTQQITKTMKMVAAAKVRRARNQVEAARPYTERLGGVLANLAATNTAGGPLLLKGREDAQMVRLIAFGADRGLCGGFNTNLFKEVQRFMRAQQATGKNVQIIAVGRKVRDSARSVYPAQLAGEYVDVSRNLGFDLAESIAVETMAAFEEGACDEVHLLYSACVSMLTQTPTVQQLIPFKAHEEAEPTGPRSSFEYEPEEKEILADLLPRNVKTQVYSAMLESAASEQAARMTAMDNATRNAGEMIKGLTLEYNRSRQAAITKELIEIISGAEAV